MSTAQKACSFYINADERCVHPQPCPKHVREPRVVPIANPFGETFSERAVHAVRDSELQIGVLITKCRVGAFSMDIFVADAVEEDASEWDALAVTLDNLADFARREAFKRKK